MDEVFATLIKNGVKTMNDVPEHLKEKVQLLLDADSVN